MKDIYKIKTRRLFIISGLLLLVTVTSVGYAQVPSVTDAERYWLTYMREEEKLARDVYLFLYDKWQSRIFNNISVSEQRHMDAIKTLLDRYEIPDPAAGNADGEFTNPDLQALYDELILQGSVSQVDALEVGVLIEEMDIDDLNAAIASTTHKSIKTIYSNLLRASVNHLKAFVSNLARYGATYEP